LLGFGDAVSICALSLGIVAAQAPASSCEEIVGLTFPRVAEQDEGSSRFD